VNVPPYIPLPLEVPQNVTTEPYLRMVGFIRRVAVLHALSLAVVVAIAAYVPSPLSLPIALTGSAILLTALSLLRTACRKWTREQLLSLAVFPAFLALAGFTAQELFEAGWLVWPPAVGVACAAAYAVASGRDLSFVGMYALAGLASSGVIVGVAVSASEPWSVIWVALCLNALTLLYYVYDLGALLSRRRMGEELGAVIDLYRDVLNVFGYSIRVVHHWREHRIWSK
jgi:hypothetical protein